MKLPVPLVIAMNSSINRYLALDNEVALKLERLYGKLIGVKLDVVGIDFFVLFHRNRIEVLEEFAGDADVIIRGTPLSLLALANGRSELSSSGVVVTGDILLAENFSRLLKQVDIDWEEHLSGITGDAVAHQMGNFARGIADFFKRTQSRMEDNTADYLRDESMYLPHDWEVEEFCNEVDDLRDRVEALSEKYLKR